MEASGGHTLLIINQARPGGLVGYQYTRYFAPKIPIYLKIVKCVILNILKQNTKYLKMNKSDLNKRETPGSLSSSASFAVGQRPW